MTSFIEQFCEAIIPLLEAGERPVIVLPNKRPFLSISNYLGAHISKPVWMPQQFTIEEFVCEIAGLKMIEPLEHATVFYKIYCNVLQADAQTFDEYIKWWNLLMADFSDIDMYLIDDAAIFAEISEIRAMDLWNPSNTDPTELQKRYLKFWKQLPLLYKQQREELLAAKKAYKGLAYRTALEVLKKPGTAIPSGPVIFAGFNALSLAEEQIIQYFLKNQQARIYFSSDTYFDNEQQEAGIAIRKYKKAWAALKNVIFIESNSLLGEHKQIRVIGAPKQIFQAVQAGQCVLEAMNSNGSIALIPADEQLLVPLLHHLPESALEQMNVTMGYPVGGMPMRSLYHLLCDMADEVAKYHGTHISSKILHRFINHPYGCIMMDCNDFQLSLIKKKLFATGKFMINLTDSLDIFSHASAGQALLHLLFADNHPVQKSLELHKLAIQRFEQYLQQGGRQANLVKMECQQWSQAMHAIMDCISHNIAINHMATLKNLLDTSYNKLAIPFDMNREGRVQLTGILETRMLRFDEIIITGCNEGVLPSAKVSGNSFIPFDIKSIFGLPTYRDSEAVFAYNFYQLISGAKKITCLYNTETDEMGSGEISRFILQIQHELTQRNPLVHLQHEVMKLPELQGMSRKPISKKITPEEMIRLQSLMEKGLSPTALMAYKNCQLKFYFKYIAKLNKKQEILEEAAADQMGSLIHEVLKIIYTPLVNQMITEETIRHTKSEIEQIAVKVFTELVPSINLHEGKNLLLLKTATGIIYRFIQYEKKQIRERGAIHMVHVEEQLEAIISSAGSQIKFSGHVDRIDRVGNTIRVIDYKTGFVDAKKLVVNNLADIFEQEAFDKAFQLLFYTFLYQNQSIAPLNQMQAGIVSLRKINQGFLHINYKEDFSQFMEDFQRELMNLISPLLGEQPEFTATTNNEICGRCDFVDICMR